MKTNLVTPIRIDEIKAGHHPSPTRLSDNAFYLIVLARLLQKAIRPDSLQRYLLPAVLENDQAQQREKNNPRP